jgi:phosphatidylglycerol:prolipoprotein diacylglycerol transferase
MREPSAWTHNLDPVAVTLGDVAISWYWLFYPIGLGFVLWGCFKSRHSFSITPLNLLEAATWCWVGVLVGGRFGYALLYNLDVFLKYPEALWQLWLGGMSFHGAMVGGGLALWAWTRIRVESLYDYSDMFLTFAPLGLLLGRLGNFINGELYGRVTTLPWGMVFPKSQDGQLRHPSQLYEALTEGLLLFLILYLPRSRWWKVKGRATALFFLLYGLFRSLMELFREPDPQVGLLWGGMTLGQLLSFIMMLVGIGALRTLRAPRVKG